MKSCEKRRFIEADNLKYFADLQHDKELKIMSHRISISRDWGEMKVNGDVSEIQLSISRLREKSDFQ